MGPELLQRKLPLRVPTVALPSSSDLSLSKSYESYGILWLVFQNNSLCYVMRTGDEKKVLEPDLRICMVRGLDDIDRRYCFELISPHNKHVLQADNDDLYDLWLATLRQRYLPPPNSWNNKKGCLLTNAQSRCKVQGSLRHNDLHIIPDLLCPCISAVQEATHATRLMALEGSRVSSKSPYEILD